MTSDDSLQVLWHHRTSEVTCWP